MTAETFPTDADVEAVAETLCVSGPEAAAALHALTESVAARERAAEQRGRDWAHERHKRLVMQTPPPPEEPVECCGSGRCEVCTPGYEWGWSRC